MEKPIPKRATEILASVRVRRIASANPLLAWVRENETIQAQHGILGRLDAYIVNRTRVQHYRCQLLHDKSTNPVRYIFNSAHSHFGTCPSRNISTHFGTWHIGTSTIRDCTTVLFQVTMYRQFARKGGSLCVKLLFAIPIVVNFYIAGRTMYRPVSCILSEPVQ